MKIRTLAALALLPVAAHAEETVMLKAETYSVPAATWIKIPTSMRDDHARLRSTLIGQLPKGAITLRDRIGSFTRSGQKLVVANQEETPVPAAFDANESGLFPSEWETHMLGSSLEVDISFSESASLAYRLTAPDPPLRSLLTTGSRRDRARTGIPMASTLRLNSDVPIVPVSLVAVAPDPDRQEREKRLLVSFLVMSEPPDNEEAAQREPGYTLELLGVQGSTRLDSTEVPAPELMTNLLRRSGAVAFSLLTTQVPGPRTALETVQEYPHPGRAEEGPTGPVPSRVEALPVGTTLSAQLSPIAAGKVRAIIQVDHNWREPILPSVPGKDGQLFDRTLIPYKMQLRFRDDIAPGDWALLAEEPLSEIFGPDDRETRGESCYLFGRVVVSAEDSTR